MGGAVSTGQDNDDLIDNLLEAGYIKTLKVEKVFRAVDRAEYFLPDSRINAYKDLAWKRGNLHLSAPCIYSEVMEELYLKPGLSFLNIGSGTGYLSTMVGLILGINGVNHGVELYDDVIAYALKKLEDFKKYSGAIDEYDFCEPKFMQGNCLCFSSETRQYDRIYCGAVCPETYENYMKNLLKVGGILVMPLNDQLLQVRRTSETNWDVRSVLPVSFATLVQPEEGKQDMINLMEVQPHSLQALCRAEIRSILRSNIDYEYPNLKAVPQKKAPKKKRVLRRLVVPLFDTSDESDDGLFENHRRNRNSGRVRLEPRENNDNSNPGREVGNLIDFFLNHLRDTGLQRSAEQQLLNRTRALSNEHDSENESSSEIDNKTDVGKSLEHTEDEENNEAVQNVEVKPSTQAEEVTGTVDLNKIETIPENCDCKIESEKMEVDDFSENKCSEPNTSSRSTALQQAIIEHSRPPIEFCSLTTEIPEVLEDMMNELGKDSDEDEEESDEEVEEKPKSSLVNKTRNGSSTSKSIKKREKFDSGLGDEIIEKDTNSPDISELEVMEINSCSSSDENQEERPSKRSFRPQAKVRTCGKWRRITLTSHRFDSVSSSETETGQEEPKPITNEIRTVPSPYTVLMKRKIQELPLPPVLKNYLNFYREF